MKTRFKTIVWALVVLLSLSSLLTSASWASESSATVFIYHKFGEDKYPTTNVALDRFEEQMRYLQDNDYTVIPLAELVTFLKPDTVPKALPEKTAVITIDDGYTSTYTGAWPILKKYKYPFTVFLYLKAVESKYKNFLTWAQIKEMMEAGVDFQPHTYSHNRLGTMPKGLDEAGYRKWIAEDFQKGYVVMHENLGVKPRFLALPYGEYNTIIIDEAKKSGYEAVLNQDPGSVSDATDRFRIPREPILGNEWATMNHFKKVLERVDLPVSDLSPSYEPLTQTFPKQFCATVEDEHQYTKGSFGVYVSELGWKPASLDGRKVCIDNTQTLTRRTNRVLISARKKDSKVAALHYWLLLNPHLPAPTY